MTFTEAVSELNKRRAAGETRIKASRELYESYRDGLMANTRFIDVQLPYFKNPPLAFKDVKVFCWDDADVSVR